MGKAFGQKSSTPLRLKRHADHNGEWACSSLAWTVESAPRLGDEIAKTTSVSRTKLRECVMAVWIRCGLQSKLGAFTSNENRAVGNLRDGREAREANEPGG